MLLNTSHLNNTLSSGPINSTCQTSSLDAFHPNQNLSQLIDSLREILGGHGLSSEDIDINKIKQIMESYKSDPADWSQFALHDPLKSYSRNGVVNINGNANLLILILQGELTESLYKLDGENKPKLSKETILAKEQVGYISDQIGLHKITNTSDEISVSLHLYTPPYAAMYGCSTYEENGTKHHVDMSKYYSWQGKVVNDVNSSSC
ncbi:hypothetical protein KGF56_000191 [Candida oxycetoniae]|uniref:Cysteine dioxygenase n=1 Tax=Candida oxycetoniae TaxID=497107 RepID=A0AAI9T1X1_9ASCO|nr:uncharacterized protein KGF56_000191 [Candida oxycetoniae]KAI3406899.2 hypothetical protein KGF56_000191 [Candida oxycetoniae]